MVYNNIDIYEQASESQAETYRGLQDSGDGGEAQRQRQEQERQRQEQERAREAARLALEGQGDAITSLVNDRIAEAQKVAPPPSKFDIPEDAKAVDFNWKPNRAKDGFVDLVLLDPFRPTVYEDSKGVRWYTPDSVEYERGFKNSLERIEAESKTPEGESAVKYAPQVAIKTDKGEVKHITRQEAQALDKLEPEQRFLQMQAMGLIDKDAEYIENGKFKPGEAVRISQGNVILQIDGNDVVVKKSEYDKLDPRQKAELRATGQYTLVTESATKKPSGGYTYHKRDEVTGQMVEISRREYDELQAQYNEAQVQYERDMATYEARTNAIRELDKYKVRSNYVDDTGYMSAHDSYDLTRALVIDKIPDQKLIAAGFTPKQIDDIKMNTVSIYLPEKKALPSLPYDEFMARYLLENDAPEVLFKPRGSLTDRELAQVSKIESKWYNDAQTAYAKQYGTKELALAMTRALPEKALGLPVVSKLLEPSKPKITMQDAIWTTVNGVLLVWALKPGVSAAIKAVPSPRAIAEGYVTNIAKQRGLVVGNSKANFIKYAPTESGNLKPLWIEKGTGKTVPVGDVQPVGWKIELPQAVSPEFNRGKLYTGGSLIDIGGGKVIYTKTVEGMGAGGASRPIGASYREVFPKTQGYVDALELKQGYSYKPKTPGGKFRYYDQNGVEVTQAQATKPVKTWQIGVPTGKEITEAIQIEGQAARQAFPRYTRQTSGTSGESALGLSRGGLAMKGAAHLQSTIEVFEKGNTLYTTIREQKPLSGGDTATKVKPFTDTGRVSPALARELKLKGWEVGRAGGGLVAVRSTVQQYQVLGTDRYGYPLVRPVPIDIPDYIRRGSPEIVPMTPGKTAPEIETRTQTEIAPLTGTATFVDVKTAQQTKTEQGEETKPGQMIKAGTAIEPAPVPKPQPRPKPQPFIRTPTKTEIGTKPPPPPPPEPPVPPPPPPPPPGKIIFPPPAPTASEKEKRDFIDSRPGIVARRRGALIGKSVWRVHYGPDWKAKPIIIIGDPPAGAHPAEGKGSVAASATLTRGTPPPRPIYDDTGAVDDVIIPRKGGITIRSVKDKTVKPRHQWQNFREDRIKETELGGGIVETKEGATVRRHIKL